MTLAVSVTVPVSFSILETAAFAASLPVCAISLVWLTALLPFERYSPSV
jgi:hypothetical protein